MNREKILRRTEICTQFSEGCPEGATDGIARRGYFGNVCDELSEDAIRPEFYTGELNAIAFGYTKLLEESSGLLEELKTVVNANGLSMSDKERMDVIDRVYRDVKDYRNLVAYYTNRNISVSYLRAKEKNDTKRILSLYGSANERYW